MSFCKIQPALGEESSPSGSNPSQSTSESTSSDPHRIPHGEKSGAGSTIIHSKRRRVPESVTRNACMNCKKARAKCDGQLPCVRCSTRPDTSPCVYEAHVKHAKEELLNQIKELRAKDRAKEQILMALSSDEQGPDIFRRLKSGESYDTIVEWLRREAHEETGDFSPIRSTHSNHRSSDFDFGDSSPLFCWTSVTSDNSVLDHLFQLYFAWVHPVYTLFNEGHFVNSYTRQKNRYCSSILVDAICAMACKYHTPSDSDRVDMELLGSKFCDAVRANIDPMDKSITTIQAFAVMFLVEMARGKGLRASSYLRIAGSNLVETAFIDRAGFDCVLKTTIRGIRCLDVEWSQVTFQLPTTLGPRFIGDIEGDDYGSDDAQWFFYRYINDSCPAWPGLLATTNREKTKLIEIIGDASMMLYSSSAETIQARHILEQYGRYIAWRNALPEILGNLENNRSQPLPHVLSLLILYSYSVIQLLQPLLDLEGFPSKSVEYQIFIETQQAIFLLDQHYRTQYTCRYQSVFQMFVIASLCDTVARFFAVKQDMTTKDGPEAVAFGIEALMESSIGFPVAGIFQELLRREAIECSIQLPKSLEHLMAPRVSAFEVYTLNDFIDACSRPSYRQPVFSILQKFDADFASNWITERPLGYGFVEAPPGKGALRTPHNDEEEGAQYLMQIRNLLNTD